MRLTVARIYAVLIGALAVLGLFVSGRLFELMNTDPAIDLLRVVLAIYLIYAAFIAKTPAAISGALWAVGLTYVGAGIIGLFDPSLGGLLPSELTGFDIWFHLLTGAIALWAGARRPDVVRESPERTVET